MNQPQGYISKAEAAQRLGVAGRTIERYMDQGRLLYRTSGSRTYRPTVHILIASLEAFEAQRDAPPVLNMDGPRPTSHTPAPQHRDPEPSTVEPLTPERRREIASRAARARWDKAPDMTPEQRAAQVAPARAALAARTPEQRSEQARRAAAARWANRSN